MTIWQGEGQTSSVSEKPGCHQKLELVLFHYKASHCTEYTIVKQYCMVVLFDMTEQCGDSCLWVLRKGLDTKIITSSLQAVRTSQQTKQQHQQQR